MGAGEGSYAYLLYLRVYTVDGAEPCPGERLGIKRRRGRRMEIFGVFVDWYHNNSEPKKW